MVSLCKALALVREVGRRVDGVSSSVGVQQRQSGSLQQPKKQRKSHMQTVVGDLVVSPVLIRQKGIREEGNHVRRVTASVELRGGGAEE